MGIAQKILVHHASAPFIFIVNKNKIFWNIFTGENGFEIVDEEWT